MQRCVALRPCIARCGPFALARAPRMRSTIFGRLTATALDRAHRDAHDSSTGVVYEPRTPVWSTTDDSSKAAAPPNAAPLTSTLCMMGGLAVLGLACASGADASTMPVAELADMDASTAKTLESILRPLFAIYTVLYVVRIPMTWFPNVDINSFPWAIVSIPTEPFLSATRKIVPSVGGVDVTPIVLVALISFFNEVLLGPQGLLLLIQRQGSL